ncbi:MAG: hypothetical protein IKN42_06685 [Elusimicrobia bacterium]|nr:hypothetical protein [Elusimicrobiota bacterium]
MKILKIILLTSFISLLIFILSVFVVFKFIITPERIDKYLENYIEKSFRHNMTKAELLVKPENDLLDELYTTSNSKMKRYKHTDKDLDNLKVLESFMDIKQLKTSKIFDNLSDLNFFSSQLSSDINMRMDLLKYRINEYLSNKKIKEE